MTTIEKLIAEKDLKVNEVDLHQEEITNLTAQVANLQNQLDVLNAERLEHIHDKESLNKEIIDLEMIINKLESMEE